LTEGFLSGHLYLNVDPAREMLALRNPLDPIANSPYRLHDASLYRGHYYVYFGPVPVVTLYLPWRVIAGASVPNNLAVIVYLLAGWMFSSLLLLLLLRASGVLAGAFLTAAMVLALGLCQTSPILLRRADVYEAAVAASFCFFMAGLYFLARHLTAAEPARLHALLAGLFLGLTPGCRPNYALGATIVVGGALLYLWRVPGRDPRSFLREAAWFAVPFALCGILLAGYNYARFGNALETGQSYQLVGNVADRGLPADPSGLPGLYKFMVETPLCSRHFPFLELASKGKFGAIELPRGVEYSEPIAGILVISPLCLAGLLLPVFGYRFRALVPSAVRAMVMLIYGSAVICLLSMPAVVHRVAQRYEMDFVPELLVISLFVLIWLASRITPGWSGRAVACATIGGIAFSAAVQGFLSINGYRNGLMWVNPPAFQQLATLFGDDQKSVRHLVSGLALEGQIDFKPQPPGTREALLTSGIYGRGNAIFFEHLGKDRIRCGYLSSGNPLTFGPEFSVLAGRRYPVAIAYMQAAQKLKLLVADELWEIDGAVLWPAAASEITLARNETGEVPNVRVFSGGLNVPGGVRLQFDDLVSTRPSSAKLGPDATDHDQPMAIAFRSRLGPSLSHSPTF
jgi:hypothetical protein